MPTRADIRALLRSQIADLWSAGRVELVDANYAEGVIDHDPVPGQPAGRAAMKEVVRAFRSAMPDLERDEARVNRLGIHNPLDF